jgi:hypothetical protein
MEQLPPDLMAVLPDGAGPVVERWWAGLTDADRQRVAGLWDNRLEVCFFAPQPDAAGGMDLWEEVPAVQGGRFVPSDDDGREEWLPGYFEHLIQHPELVLAYEPPRRVFYICTQHAEAQACVAAGVVPPDFVCPLAEEACPLMSLRGARLSATKHVKPDAAEDRYCT